MKWIRANSECSRQGFDLVENLQQELVQVLEEFAMLAADRLGAQEIARFDRVQWFRDGGKHGGGLRYQAPVQGASSGLVSNDSCFAWPFNAASSNISQVQYEDLPEKPLSSATALSSIVHPAHPLLPSIHLHVSWTEHKSGSGYWRIMADLNPSHPDAADTQYFQRMIEEACRNYGQELYNLAVDQGNRYFQIPALSQTRGVFHYYLEEYNSSSFSADLNLAAEVAQAAIRAYGLLLKRRLSSLETPTPEQLERQLAYHTLYFFQVLTLDRGTTAGLLVHADNDVGILGSLPARVSRDLLESWKERVPELQKILLADLLGCLSADRIALVTVPVKQALALAVRRFYQSHPVALELQAKGDTVPPTLANHLG